MTRDHGLAMASRVGSGDGEPKAVSENALRSDSEKLLVTFVISRIADHCRLSCYISAFVGGFTLVFKSFLMCS